MIAKKCLDMPTAFGTFEELLEGKAQNVEDIAKELKRQILKLHPETTEVVRLGDKAASFGHGPKKMSEAYCYIMPLKDRVNLGFYHGALLGDPSGLLEGTGKKLRHVKVRSVEAVGSFKIIKLLESAITERKKALGL